VTPGAAARGWRLWRLPVAVGVVLLVVAVGTALVHRSAGTGELDPDSVDPGGTRALATLLGGHGVDVQRAGDTDRVFREAAESGPAGLTVVVPFPELLAPRTLARLADLPRRVRVLLVQPDPFTLDALDTGVQVEEPAAKPPGGPGCALPAARVAGPADVDGWRYAAPDGATSCYDGGLVVTRTGPQIVYLGSAEPLTNDRLDERGNAALALGLLTESPRLLWLTMAAPELDSSGADNGLLAVLPGWVLPAAVLLLVAGAAAALWQGRRLGAPVAEPLPVIVRSAETVEGRARLYRRSRARDRAVAALRGGALSRLLPTLGLGREPGRQALVEAVAERSGVPAADVDALLHGPVPPDDARLVAVADGLDRLVAATLNPEGTPQ
jgi:hypothetical protein